MSLRSIVKYGDPILRKKTAQVPQIDDELLHTIGDMFQTMYAAPGIGLAANQVGISRSFAVIDIQPGGQRHPLVIINPVIEERSGSLYEEEGCLSIPGFAAKVKRAEKVRVRALNEHGLPVVIEAEGLMARCLQHEIDHLNGKLYIDRLSLVPRLRVRRDIDRRRKQGLF
jgi:peptide deformylase